MRAQGSAGQVVTDVLGDLTVGVAFRPGQRVGDAARGDGVGAQVFRHTDAAGPTCPSHALEKYGHRAGIEIGFGQHLHAHTIGFLLVGAGEVDLFLKQRGLTTHRRCERGVATPRCAEQRCCQQEARSRQAHPVCRLDHACDVPLGHVGDLVGQHGCELALGLGFQDQAGMHADVPARAGKGVDGGIADPEEVEASRGIVAFPRQLVADGLEVVGQQWVGFQLLAGADRAHELLSKALVAAR